MCGASCCKACRHVEADGLSVCPDCAPAPALDPPPAVEPHSPGVEAASLPWEHPEPRSDLVALYATIKCALLEPMRFAEAAVRPRGDLVAPLLFALLCGVFGYLGQTGADLFAGHVVDDVILGRPVPALPVFVYDLLTAPAFFFMFTVTLFVVAGLAHGLLSLAGQAPAPFEATFRAIAFAYAAKVLMLIPILGPMVTTFFVVYLTLTALRAAQQASLFASLLALLPVALVQMSPTGM